jgi:hypothetical protein
MSTRLCSRYNFRFKGNHKAGVDPTRRRVVSVTVAASFVFIQSSAAASRVLPEKLVGLVAPVGMLLCLFLLTRWMLAREGRSPRDQGASISLYDGRRNGSAGSWPASPLWRSGVASVGSALHFTGSRILNFEVGAMAATFAAWHIWQGVPWIAAMTATTVASFLFASIVLR